MPRCRSSRRPATAVAWGLTALLVLGAAGFAQAQSQRELERRRTELAQRIDVTSQLLNGSSRDRAAALDRLVGLQSQIRQREDLILVLGLQLAHADSSVGRTAEVLTAMERDLTLLTEEYSRMARAALRQQLTHSRVSFLLSAASVSEAFRRLQYLRQYDATRQRQLRLIRATRDALAGKMDGLAEVRAAKERLLAAELEQQALLEAELSDKGALLRLLRSDASRLRVELGTARRDQRKLDGVIDGVIRAASDADARRAAPARVDGEGASSEAYALELAGDFRQNRGRLPWPVEKGFVSKPFGRRPHPTLRKVEVNNNGVDIRTEPGTRALAVFEGEVVGLQEVPGYNYMVILQHGSYYTVYSNLAEAYVKQGARVGTRDALGRVAVDPVTSTSELHFEVWEERTTEDPSGWLR